MLSDTLQAQFTNDGDFDFDAILVGIVSNLLEADFGDVTFDVADIIDLIAGLAPSDISDTLDSAGAGLVDLRRLDEFGSVAELLAPLERLGDDLRSASLVEFDARGSEIGELIGIDAVDETINTITTTIGEGPIADLFGVLGALAPGSSPFNAFGRLEGPIGGTLGLLTLIGGLMATEAISVKLLARSTSVGAMLDIVSIREATRRLDRFTAMPLLAATLATTDPNDPVVRDQIVQQTTEFIAAIQDVHRSWTQGVRLGEIALGSLDVSGCTAELVTARGALDESTLRAVGELATMVRGFIDPILEIPLPEPGRPLDETVGEALVMLGDLRDKVDAVDAPGVADAVAGSLDPIVRPITDVVAVLEGASASLMSAILAVRDLVQGIDLSPIETAVDSAIQPVVDVLDGIEVGINAAQDSLVAVAEKVGELLLEIRSSIEDMAALVTAAVGRLSDALTAVDLAAVQGAIDSGLGSVAETLSRAQLSPYFDAAIDGIGTTADIVDAVPFGMLPSDVQQEVVEAVKPVKEIRFDLVADELQAELASIMDSLDTGVLAAVDTAYQDVLAFLASANPKLAIAAFEEGPFADFQATVMAIDPSAVLEPVDQALQEIRALLSGINLKDDVLALVQGAFDDLTARFNDLDPDTLLEPMRQDVDDLRRDVANSLHFDEWEPALETVQSGIIETLGQVDAGAAMTALELFDIDSFLNDLPTASELIASFVSTFAMARGISADVESWDVVQTWFGGTDGRAAVEANLDGSAAVLVETRDAVRELDLGSVAAAAQMQYRAMKAAADDLPDGSMLKSTLVTLLSGPSPSELFGPVVDNRRRYLVELEEETAALVQISVNGHSELDVITDGLVDALKPITSIGARVRSLLERLGFSDPDESFVSIIETLFDTAGPDRLFPLLVDLMVSIRDKLVELLGASLGAVGGITNVIESTVNLIDIGPMIDEVRDLHGAIGDQIRSLSPDALLGDVIARFDATVDRLETFDPLAPVRIVVDDMALIVMATFETLRPTIIFEDVCDTYETILELATGLDVRSLLEPILTALDDISVQLDSGLEETAAALGRLQAALPGQVSSSSASGSVGTSGGLTG